MGKPRKQARVGAALEEIAQRMARGERVEDLDEQLDRLLGTALPDRDPAIEEAWERAHRRKQQ